MATHSSILSWRIPGTEEPGGLQSMKLRSVGYNWSDRTHTREDRRISLEDSSKVFGVYQKVRKRAQSF